MHDAEHIYAFDIETLNDNGQGLDPTREDSRITQIALATHDETFVFEGSEFDILLGFSEALDSLPSGLLGGWNSSIFDLPWIADRAPKASAHWISRELTLIAQPGLKPKYSYTPGHTTGYTAIWQSKDRKTTHSHLDIAYSYKAFAEAFGTNPDTGKPVVPWSLKPVAKAAGIGMFEIDRTRLHEYSEADQRRYVASDVHGTRELILLKLGLA